MEDGDDLEARTGMLYGSLLAGIAFGNSGVSTAHALQFAVGAATHTSHGLGTGLLLPYVMEFNRPAPTARPRRARARDAARRATPVEHVHALGQRIGLPASLAEIGIAQEDLRGMAESSFKFKRLIDNNPRPLDADALERILDAAWHGEPGAARRGSVRQVVKGAVEVRGHARLGLLHVAALDHREQVAVLVAHRGR